MGLLIWKSGSSRETHYNETWPESWVIQKCSESLENFASLTCPESNQLNDYLEHGLGAGKHREFHELGKHLGLSEGEAFNRCCMNVSQCYKDEFSSLISQIEAMLNV